MKILIGISGSVAAYKTPLLIRELLKEGFEVKTVITENAKKFVSPYLLGYLTRNKVYDWSSLFKGEGSLHIELARWCDIFAIVPADYSTIGRIGTGIAEDPLSLIASALPPSTPLLLAPSMHDTMWQKPILQDNLKKIERCFKACISGPIEGELLHDKGMGRLKDIEGILDDIYACVSKSPLKKKKVLLTYGATYEPIDEVRGITNRSSGILGFHIAKSVKRRGAYLVQIIGRTGIIPYKFADKTIRITTVDEVYQVLKEEIKYSEILIMAMAISDFKPDKRLKGKIPRQKRLDLSLSPTIDVLKTILKIHKPLLTIGFALSNSIETALKKMEEKGTDIMVFNTLRAMENREMSGAILLSSGARIEFEKIEKQDFSELLLDVIEHELSH